MDSARTEAAVSSIRRVSRWDLDKTYLRTEFETLRDLIRTALEAPEEKRTNPGAATLLREMSRSGVAVHILSGSPRQMRARLEMKLRLDGIEWESFTLKPNLSNILRLRFRAVRDQLGYKLPALLSLRLGEARGVQTRETLFGDDAEADAFVYSLYGDVTAGRIDSPSLAAICRAGRVYDDFVETIVDHADLVPKDAATVQRILIHLDQQSAPENFQAYGRRIVPFYNYLQAAFVCHEDGLLGAKSVLRVGAEMVEKHRFDGDRLARSYLEIARRGHLRGDGIEDISAAFESWFANEGTGLRGREISRMVQCLGNARQVARDNYHPEELVLPDYLSLVKRHNRRRS